MLIGRRRNQPTGGFVKYMANDFRMSDSTPDSSAKKFGEAPGEDSAEATGTFERFVDSYYQAAYRFALGLSGNHHDACDITQQAFYLAYVRSHQLRDSGKRKQWLFTILHREFLRGRRRRIAHPETSLEFSEPELPPINVDHATALDSKDLLVVLQTLDEIFKTPLVLFYLNQLSYVEIAAALGIPIGTVMSRLARGKQMLRHQLETKRKDGTLKIIPISGLKMQGGTDG
jgi:RNA polymerase sigma-70 factor (ECF subfamily)